MATKKGKDRISARRDREAQIKRTAKRDYIPNASSVSAGLARYKGFKKAKSQKVAPFLTQVVHAMMRVDDGVHDFALVTQATTLKQVAFALQQQTRALMAQGARVVVPVRVTVTDHLSVEMDLPPEFMPPNAERPEHKALLTSEPIRASVSYIFGEVISEFEAIGRFPNFPNHLRGASRMIITPIGDVLALNRGMAPFPFGTQSLEDPRLAVAITWQGWDDEVAYVMPPTTEEELRLAHGELVSKLEEFRSSFGVEDADQPRDVEQELRDVSISVSTKIEESDLTHEEVEGVVDRSVPGFTRLPDEPNKLREIVEAAQAGVNDMREGRTPTMKLPEGAVKRTFAVISGAEHLGAVSDEQDLRGFHLIVKETRSELIEMGMSPSEADKRLAAFRAVLLDTAEEFEAFQAEIDSGRARLLDSLLDEWHKERAGRQRD